ncbi:hypothetical protein, partial [Micromonospora sp. S-DT3-3-22]|uniref:hypothetical protein n=1 Tax=Micromonospora sp. S-DT3-3-22 TaxID=2755359 RepID=UPI001E6429AB
GGMPPTLGGGTGSTPGVVLSARGGGVLSTVGGTGIGFAVTTVATPARGVAVASTARPAARTTGVPARRWTRTGRRRLPVG